VDVILTELHFAAGFVDSGVECSGSATRNIL
jgi:hypothetical protein